MGAQALVYYRVTCDTKDCKAYINIAARDLDDLGERLSGKPHNWTLIVDQSVDIYGAAGQVERSPGLFVCSGHE